MKACFDASALVALFCQDAHTARITGFMARAGPTAIVSDFAAAEFASAVARKVRERQYTAPEATAVFGVFDDWIRQNAVAALAQATDTVLATRWLRRLDLNLRTPDAIHLALADRLGATLVTFDDAMAAAARTLGVPVTNPGASA